jgi:HPt (histidine-containing phosphotransfer) domain-containing protein
MAAQERQTRSLYQWVKRLWHDLPQGRSLESEEWARRHFGIVLLLWLHAVGLPAFGFLATHHVVLGVVGGVILGILAVVATIHAQLERILAKWIPNKTIIRGEGDRESSSSASQQTSNERQRIQPKARACDELSAEPGVIDQAAWTAIRALQRPGHPDIFARVCAQYMKTSQETVDRIRLAVQSKDPDELRVSAHRLKSSSAQMGAAALAADCRELEMMGAGLELERAEETLSRLERHYEASCAALKHELAKHRLAA